MPTPSPLSLSLFPSLTHSLTHSLLLLLLYTTVTSSSLPTHSLTALHDLHTATNGPSWVYPTPHSIPWNFTGPSPDPCVEQWSGVTCTQSATHCQSSPCDITRIALSRYSLTGQLPSSLINLTTLNYFNVEKNSLSGQIPWEYFYSLTTLSYLYLNENNFQGSLPSDINKLAHVNLLKLRENNLVGSIPDSFGEISNLGEVHLSLNQLTGTIPETISKLTKLYYFSVRFNQLTGTIPSFFGSLSLLEQFSVYTNKMVGTIPPELGKLRNLEFFIAHTNDFEGSIPTALGDVTSFKAISLSSNRLSGSIPETFCQLQNLFEIEIFSNSLTSTLPDCFTRLTNLENLNLNNNKLRGRLPSGMGSNWMKLLNLDLSYNYMSGPLPNSLAKLPAISSIVLQDNRFSGNLNFITNESLPSCTFFDVASNAITGPLPQDLFRLPQLQHILLSSNCFTGQLPESVCQSPQVQTLSMNGLASGNECNIVRIWNSYFSSKDFGGSIPRCIWEMPSLVTLYLSANMLTGDIDLISIPHNTHLDIVSLSGNTLAGSVSYSLQTRNFSHLDISWNKITGTLNDMEAYYGDDSPSSGSINMEVNYISGIIPNHILTGQDVRVLDGNLFECSDGSFQKPDLPPHDKASEGYACGSAQLDLSMLLYFLVFIASATISLRLVYGIDFESSPWLVQELKRFFQSQSEYLSLTDMNPPTALRLYARLLQQLLKSMCILAVVAVMFSIVVIPAMRSTGASTTVHLYSWYMSFMYFQGLIPGLVYLFLWSSCLIYFSCSTAVISEKSVSHVGDSDKAVLVSSSSDLPAIEMGDFTKDPVSRKRSSTFTELFFSNAEDKNDLDTTASFIFKTSIVTLFNFVSVLTINVYYVTIVKAENVDQDIKVMVQFAVSIYMCFWNSIAVGFMVTKLKPGIPAEIFLRSLFRIINTVFMPIVAVLLSSSKCFSAFIFGLDDITNIVYYETCSLQTFSNGVITCVEYDYSSIEDSMERPFVYNGGCTDAIMSDYIPVHIYSYAFDFILMPVVYLISTTWLAKFQNYIVLPKMMWTDTKVERRELLRAGNLLAVFFGHFALATSFGLTSPVLVLVICLAFMQDLVIYIYYLRKYLKFSDRCKDPSNPFGGLDEAAAEVPTNYRAIILIIFFTSAFCCSFLVMDKVWYRDYSSEQLPYKIWTLLVPFFIVAMLPSFQKKYNEYFLRTRRGRALE